MPFIYILHITFETILVDKFHTDCNSTMMSVYQFFFVCEYTIWGKGITGSKHYGWFLAAN